MSKHPTELPFDWNRHFVYSKDGTKCLGACALMAVKYWRIDLSNEDCHRILSQLAVPAFEGADAGQVVKAVEHVIGEATETNEDDLGVKLDRFFTDEGAVTKVPLTSPRAPIKQEFFHARRVDTLRAALSVSKAIPQIVIYDEVLATYHEESPGGHACIVQKLDFDANLVYLIDPNIQARRTPTYYTFDDFERGWRAFEQATCIIYPRDLYHTVRSVVATSVLGARP